MVYYLYTKALIVVNEKIIESDLTDKKIKEVNLESALETTQKTIIEDYVEYFDSRFPSSLSLILLMIGMFGNLLCLYIFIQPNMRKNATFIYLACLALVDWFVLVLGLGDIVIISFLKYVLRDSNIFVCRIHSFLTYVFTHLSSFLLASVSIDRAIATNLIRFSKVYTKPKMAFKIIAFNIVMASIINLHCVFFMGYYRLKTPTVSSKNYTYLDFLNSSSKIFEQEYGKLGASNVDNEFHCATESGTKYDKFLDPYFKWIDLFSYAIVPFLIMAICTLLIIRVLFKSNMRLNLKKTSSSSHSRFGSQEHESISKRFTNNRSSLATNFTKISSFPYSEAKSGLLSKNFYNKHIDRKPINQRANKAKHLTYTLITLNCLFFCLVSPLVITLIAIDGFEVENKILINFVYLLAYSNHSFNFILYALSCPPYREALFRIFRIKK